MALNNDDIKQLIAILQKGLTSEDAPEDKPIKKKTKKDAINTKSVRIDAQNSRENKFLTMGVKHLHKEDIEIDRALNKNPPTPRTRKFKPVNVVCRSCGKREEINPTLLYDSADRYKCNKCSSSAG